jgi:hypothetical protein
MLRMALIATLMSGVSTAALPLTAAANHYRPEKSPNGVLWEPAGPDADGRSRIIFPWSRS